jgi:hypothetical protein
MRDYEIGMVEGILTVFVLVARVFVFALRGGVSSGLHPIISLMHAYTFPLMP